MLIESRPLLDLTQDQSIKIQTIRQEIIKNPESLEKIIISNLENSDSFSANHSYRLSQNVSRFSLFFEGLNQKINIQEMEVAALCHDVGKICLPVDILNKKDHLDIPEFNQIKTHPIFSRMILEDIPEIDPKIVDACLHHHERWNGSGYPDGLEGENIPYQARVLAVIDCFDALTSKRSYHESKCTEEALEIMSEKSNRCFDPDILDAFSNFISPPQFLLDNDLTRRSLA